jgi:hypothetical protein
MLTKRLAYEKWLGIKEGEQPPTLYRLLALNIFETDNEIISNAADSRIGFIRQFQIGENATVAAQVLNELARAQIVLLNPQKKAAYDAQLRNAAAYDRANPWEGSSEPSSQSAVVRTVGSASGRTIPQARAMEPLQAILIANDATKPEVDVVSLVSESPSTGSRKRPTKPPNRQGRSPAIAMALAGGVLAGCVLGLLAYYFLVVRQETPNKVATDSVPSDPPKSTEIHRQPEKSVPDTSRIAAVVKEKPVMPQRDGGRRPFAAPPRLMPSVPRAAAYDEARLKKERDELQRLSKAVKKPNDSFIVAEKALVLADWAIVLDNAQIAKDIAAISLAAARNAESLPLERRATVLLIQLQAPLSDTLKQIARRRLGSNLEQSVAESSEESRPVGPSLRNDEDSTKTAVASASHDAKWGKTEDQRRKIFFDLLKAVDDYGITPEGRKAWKSIQARNGIDSRVTLGILNEGFGTFSDWDQPDGGGRASARANRMSWIAARTRTMSEPMLTE